MLAISIVNLILSIFGITVSSIFILFWCGRYFCARFFMRRLPGSHGLFFLGTAHNRGVVEHNSVGVSPLVIAYFPTITFHQDTFLPRQDAMCTVCLGEYKEEELLRMLPQCGHNFHATCIDAWLQRHATCPVCRMSLQGYFVGGALAPLQPPPQPTASSQPMPSAIDEPVAVQVAQGSRSCGVDKRCMIMRRLSKRGCIPCGEVKSVLSLATKWLWCRYAGIICSAWGVVTDAGSVKIITFEKWGESGSFHYLLGTLPQETLA